MNRRSLLLAYLILIGTTLLILACAASIRPSAAAAHPSPIENQSAAYTPLYTAAPVWTNVPITDTGLNGTLLNAVTVDAAGTIWAVGNRSSTDLVIISSTNSGTSWFTFTQNLGVSSELWGIAVVSPTNIFAVGDYVPTGGTQAKTLVMHYNGSAWSPVTSASISGYDTRLLAVAATANGDVWAVGRTTSGGPPIYTLVERWDSATSSFIIVSSSSLNLRPYSTLHSVALSAANNVWVVGDSDDRALIGHWNGTSWAYSTYQPDTAVYSFQGIALDPNASGRVVGFRQVSGGNQPLIARYSINGGAISRDGVFTDTRLSGSAGLYGVAVTTTNDLWAVGTYTLTEHYDGLSWEIVPAEQVGSVQILYGDAVDPVRDGAWAVGYYTNGGTFLPLIERYARPVTPQPPKHTVTYYVVKPDALQPQGIKAKLGITAGIVILAFGKPAAQNNVSGTLLPGADEFIPTNKIVDSVEKFADSYYSTPQLSGVPQPITIAIGTNNYKAASTDVMADAGRAFDHGLAWAQMVNQVGTYVYTKGYSSLIKIAGGNDMEIDWNDPDKTTAWANGFNSAALGYRYYNFGDCAGCPYNMSNSWTYTDVYHISWGIQAALPFPQIYRTDAAQARQWQQVDVLTRNTSPYQRMIFAGSLTQYGACLSTSLRWQQCLTETTYNTPPIGWTQLWQALNFDPTGRTAQGLEWASDITYNDH